MKNETLKKKTIIINNRSRTFKDLSGSRFNRFLVISRDFSKKYKRPYYLCQCDCGNKKVVCATSLTRKRGNSKSCGCWNSDGKKLEYGESNFNRIYSSYEQNAHKRNLYFLLNKKEFKKLIDGNCYYCGSNPKQIFHNKKSFGQYIYNGIDRLNSNIGYKIDNCVSCCGICNMMKNKYSENYFINHIKKIINNYESKI